MNITNGGKLTSNGISYMANSGINISGAEINITDGSFYSQNAIFSINDSSIIILGSENTVNFGSKLVNVIDNDYGGDTGVDINNYDSYSVNTATEMHIGEISNTTFTFNNVYANLMYANHYVNRTEFNLTDTILKLKGSIFSDNGDGTPNIFVRLQDNITINMNGGNKHGSSILRIEPMEDNNSQITSVLTFDDDSVRLNINGGRNILLVENRLGYHNNSQINIEEGSTLELYQKATFNSNIGWYDNFQDIGLIRLSKGFVDTSNIHNNVLVNGANINLSGILKANIQIGKAYLTYNEFEIKSIHTINFNSSVSKLDGWIKSDRDFPGENDNDDILDENGFPIVHNIILNFNSTHTLSNAITGTIGTETTDITELNVNSGTLTFDKSTGTIGTLTLGNGSTLDIGTQTVNATNVIFNANSTLKLNIASAESYGKINNTGDITIGDNTTLNITVANGVVNEEVGASETFTLFNNNGAVNDFTQYIAENSRYDFEYSTNDANDITIGQLKIISKGLSAENIVDDIINDTTDNSNIAKLDNNTRQTIKTVAELWDNIDINDDNNSNITDNIKAVANLLNELSQNSTTAEGQKKYLDAIVSLAPSTAPVVKTTQSNNVSQIFNVVSTRLSAGNVNNLSAGDNLFDDMSIWAQGLFNKATYKDGKEDYEGFESKSTGGAFGFEKKFNNNTITVGLSYANTSTELKTFGKNTDIDSNTFMLYGEYKLNNSWYVDAIASYGISNYKETNTIVDNTYGKYDVKNISLQALTGYTFNINSNLFTLTPEVGVRYSKNTVDSYSDTVGQTISSNSIDTTTAMADVKLAKSFDISKSFSLTPEIKAGVSYDLNSKDETTTVTLVNGSSYTTTAKSMDDMSMDFGVSLNGRINDRFNLSLSYEGRIKKDYKDHSAVVNGKWEF